MRGGRGGEQFAITFSREPWRALLVSSARQGSRLNVTVSIPPLQAEADALGPEVRLPDLLHAAWRQLGGAAQEPAAEAPLGVQAHLAAVELVAGHEAVLHRHKPRRPHATQSQHGQVFTDVERLVELQVAEAGDEIDVV